MTNDSQIDRVAFSRKGSWREPDRAGAGESTDKRGASVGSAGGIGLQAPLAVCEAAEHVIHGDRRVDHYAWLKDRKDRRVKQYLEAENQYADSAMRPTEAFQEKLYQEMLGRIQQTDLSVPYSLRGYEYFTRTEEGKQYAIYCRNKINLAQASPAGTQETQEEVLLDLNRLAVGHTYMGLGILEVSDDNQLLAYATDTTGYRQYALELKDLRIGKLLPFRVERVTSAAWAADNSTLFYVTEDEVTKRSNQLWRHELGGGATDTLLYEERDERFRIDVERTRSGAYLFLVVNSHTTSEVRYLPANSPQGTFQLVAEREDDHEYYLDHHPGGAADPGGGIFFIRTNSGGRTYRLMTAPTADPRRPQWREVIANRPGVMLAGMEAFRTHLVLSEREDGLPQLRIVDLTREAPSALAGSRRIEFAEPTYSVMLGANPEFDSGHVRYHYESLVTPRSVYDHLVRTGERLLRKQQPVLGDFDTGNYVSERLHAKAPDGTMIPLSVVRRKDTYRDGTAPLLLYGYGSYGLSMPVSFSSNRLSLLDRGMVYAIAHIRGGGELGKPWHDAGRMHQKMNTFTDFIACVEHMIAKRYASPDRVVIEGGSAGGLLLGAVINMRPELFRVVVSHVPFVDVLNTMLDASLPLTVGEYEEWGNPRLEEDYFYMKQYCPYTNVERKTYPRMLVKTAWNDSQVMYWEAAKYVAKLRTIKTDSNVLLLKTSMGAGHGGASGRYDFIREIAFDYAFLLRELGIAN
jgi:oligopeptidase B